MHSVSKKMIYYSGSSPNTALFGRLLMPLVEDFCAMEGVKEYGLLASLQDFVEKVFQRASLLTMSGLGNKCGGGGAKENKVSQRVFFVLYHT